MAATEGLPFHSVRKVPKLNGLFDRNLNTQKGNHRTRHSWAGEAETQGQQVNTIRQSDTGGQTQEGRQDTGRTEFQNKTKTRQTKLKS